ncbi:SAM-dependent methyltransferase [Saccharothrix sp. ALI-22-I]|uniref:class I SAM-dependent methyltransferase n=1 Tax=Saccharothrix sp. ALI-22-I TaxID=1933778 RepID=UPI00097C677B|nr:class I SAM-dependent methyltransferase [Saccharothrix sp. ALI-22-I]ONI92330.1 SAM-dependent methyltransferase [Saccharothrix sp. ALI-22-I]
MSNAIERTASAYSREHADVYDVVHAARGRDWAVEADNVVRLVQERLPGARSLLDVACGTGAHLERIRFLFPHVAGLELSDAMREIATRRLPGVPIHPGDMRDFHLDEQFDAVTCMCFSIAYMQTPEDLGRAAASMARHLVPGGVAVVEPWWFSEQFLDGYVTGSVAERNGSVISRLSHSVRDGRATRMTVRYTVAESTGIRDFTEQEILSLFTEDEYLAAFEQAGIRAEHLPGGPNGRGLFLGVRD